MADKKSNDSLFQWNFNLEDSDSDLVNRYLWEVFMPEEPLSDYQEFLWSKVNHFSAGSCAEDYRILSRMSRLI